MSRHAEIFFEPDGIPARAASPAEEQAAKNGKRIQGTPSSDDEIAKLVQSVFRAGNGGEHARTVAFCGVNGGVGASWVCARTAELLARGHAGRVCLVDANVRRPSLHAQFEVDRAPGFLELLQSERAASDFTRSVIEGRLWLVPAGAPKQALNGSFHTEKLMQRLTELRSEFEFVLLDTPALDVHPDAVLLGQWTDGIVLVVGCDTTRRETARNAKLSFETAQIPVLGAVLNKRKFPIPEAIYRSI